MSCDAPPPIERLRQIMAQLRDPDGGCAWDLAQDFASIAPYTLEEAYEVADAIERGAMDDLKEELGDLLLQVVFHAQMADEAGAFDFDDVAQAINEKLVRRHPHIFADGPARTPEEIKRIWDEIKAQEKAKKAALPSVLDDVPVGLPALSRAQKLQKRMAKLGFDWPDLAATVDKIDEEVAEFQAAARSGDIEAMTDELGDVLFTLVNTARAAGLDAETALTAANAKFSSRVRHMEAALKADGREVAAMPLADWEARWQAAKRAEKAAKRAGTEAAE